MEPAKGSIAVVADSSPARTADTATEILAAALSELLREAKRHTVLLEALVNRPAAASSPASAAGPAVLPRKSAAATLPPPASPKSHKGTRSGSGSTACFSVEELRSRARAHNHLLDIESPKSRAILALLRDDGTVPDHFPADIADLMALTSPQLHGLLRAYGQPDSNATLTSQRAAFGRFIGLHKYCKG